MYHIYKLLAQLLFDRLESDTGDVPYLSHLAIQILLFLITEGRFVFP